VPPDLRRIRLGAHGERLAGEHLERAGYEVIERNARCGRLGELDIVARGERCLVFCEVKTRVAGTHRGPDGPLDAIGPRKRERLRRMATQWLAETAGDQRPRRPQLRFDAIGVMLTPAGRLLALEHLEDAF
jgi:putative endonuclease